jgi:hypothetical protein
MWVRTMIVMQRLHVFLDLMSEDKDDLTDLYEGLRVLSWRRVKVFGASCHGDESW